MSESSSPEDLRAREVLDEVLAVVPTAILIGGWASWTRTGGAMSHDIDLIVGYTPSWTRSASTSPTSRNRATSAG